MIKIKESMMSKSTRPGFWFVESVLSDDNFKQHIKQLYRNNPQSIVPDIAMSINFFSGSSVAQPVTTESDKSYIILNNKLYDIFEGKYVDNNVKYVKGTYTLSENYNKLFECMKEKINFNVLGV